MTINVFSNMQCELCGATLKGTGKTVRIEGAELQVCVQCEKYGKEVQRPKKSTLTKGPARPIAMPPTKRRRDVFDMIVGEIVEDYGDRIRKARMEKGWTTKELALELKERELLIKRIEKGDLIPEDEVREKLEKALGIKLIEGAAEEEAKRKQGQVVPTLGDVISIRKVQK